MKITSIKTIFYLSRFVSLLAAILICGPSADVVGQSVLSSITGAVTDANGAAVSNAAVKITNAATNFERAAKTNEDGEFVFTDLPPAIYRVRVAATGFSAKTVENVVLNVNDRRALRIELATGDVSATVTVEDNSRAETATVETTVDREFVENLPLNGRSFQNLIALAPGVVQTPASLGDPGQFSVNGQRTSSNYYTVDGVSANFGISVGANAVFSRAEDGVLPALSAGGGTNALVSVDALQEFKVQTSGYAPEFGRTAGGQIQIVTRSGSNDFSGSLFEYFRNNALDANDWFANRAGLPRAALRQNDFGGVIGGPVFLPRFGEGGKTLYDGRNRTFFFFSYEGLRLREPRFGMDVYPTLSARAAALPATAAIVNAYPLPNGADLGDGTAVFTGNYSNPSQLDATSLRIDHYLNNRFTVFGRYNHAPSSSVTRGNFSGFMFALNNPIENRLKTETLTFGSTQIFGGKVSNETRVNFSRSGGANRASIDTFGGGAPPPDAAFLPPFTNSQETSSGIINFGGLSGLLIGRTARNSQRQFNLVDNLSVAAGDHQLKVGVDYRRLTPEIGGLPYQVLGFFFDLNGIPGTGGVGGLLGGIALGANVTASDDIRLASDNFSFYGQDTWRVNRRLTLTYGLRWEYNQPPKALDGKYLSTITTTDNLAQARLAPAGTPLYDTLHNAFAPRLGVSYVLFDKPNRELTLRGGAGIFYDLPLGIVNNAATGPPFNRVTRYDPVPFPLPPELAVPPPFTLTGPFDTIAVFASDFTLPRAYQFNVRAEQSLGAKSSFSAAYTGALGRKLLRTEGVQGVGNQSFRRIDVTRNASSSNYHSLQLQLRTRLTNRLQILASHTWSHSIDDVSTSADLLPPGYTSSDARLNRGSSDFDVRHAFSAALTYELKGFKSNRFAGALLNGWATDAVVRLQTAFPVDIYSLVFTPFGEFELRPDLIPNAPIEIEDANAPGGRRFNDAPVFETIDGEQVLVGRGAFRMATNGNGNFGRNVLRGFPLRQVDLAVRRQFNLTERFRLQLRAEFFNALNTANFAAPSGDLENPFFGVSTQSYGRGLGTGGATGGQNPLYSVGGARSVQLGVKFLF